MKNRYFILTKRQSGKKAFTEDGVTYYAIWYDDINAARHGLAILGDEVESKNFD